MQNKPMKVGDPIDLVPRQYGKTIISQKFFNPNAEDKKNQYYDYTFFDSNRGAPSIIMPVTSKLEVVAIKQFRHAAYEYVWELPGGGPNNKEETPKEVAQRECEEETGYLGKVILLSPQAIFIDPEGCTVPFWAFLIKDCKKTGVQNLDTSEQSLKTHRISMRRWLEMIRTGEIKDSKTLAVTLLALPYFAEIKQK